MPHSERRVREFAKRAGWDAFAEKCRPSGQTGGGKQYHISLLPDVARARLRHTITNTLPHRTVEDAKRSHELWSKFNALSQKNKDICKKRLAAVDDVEERISAGAKVVVAVAEAAKVAGVSDRHLFRWRQMLAGVRKHDRLAALSPSLQATSEFAECHPMAWEAIKSDYLRPERPRFSAVVRRVVNAAKKHGWAPIPSERTLRRRLAAEVSRAEQIVMRERKEEAKKLYPAQRRTRSHLHAMQLVNMDGHKLDLFVKLPWKEGKTRVILLGIQDLYSGKIVAWRLTESETWEAVRLVIGDMVEAYGIPDGIYLDNGKAFASKWISGKNVQRFRFKVKREDPMGLLTTLAIETHFTLPYSGQSKPIERAWRDLAEEICRHPSVAGAFTGTNVNDKPENHGSRIIPLADLQSHVALRIEEHNARTDRNTATAKKRSFDAVFAESMAHPATIVRQPSPAQRDLWLLASEGITARKPDGAIHYQGNRYHAPELNQLVGKKLIIRFDPDALYKPIRVYDLDNKLICEARCIDDTGFNTTAAGREHAKARKNYLKAIEDQAAAHRVLSPMELGKLYDDGRRAQAKQQPIKTKVTRLITGNLAHAPEPDAISDDEMANSFSRSLTRMSGVIEFPTGDAVGQPTKKRRAGK
nr:transposase domain-containing protein [Rhizobium sp. CFBP 8762]